MNTIRTWFQFQSTPPVGHRGLALSRVSLRRVGILGVVICCLALLTWISPHSNVQAKEVRETNLQGAIVLVDRTNPNDVTFSLLDRAGILSTFHLTLQTRFEANQSATQLAPNLGVQVNAVLNKSGNWNAMRVHFLHNPNALALRGTLQSYDSSAGQITLALKASNIVMTITDQTKVEGVDSLSTIPLGSRINVNAQVQPDGSYLALTIKVKQNHVDGDHHKK